MLWPHGCDSDPSGRVSSGSNCARDANSEQLRHAPWTSLSPGLAIGAAVLGFNLLGDALRDALDPRALEGRT